MDNVNKCKDCIFYEPDVYGEPEKYGHWGDCNHKSTSLISHNIHDPSEKDALIIGGADDDSGSFLHMKPDFGCILFKPLQKGSE